MSDVLVLIAGDSPEAALAWARADSEGRIQEQGLAPIGAPIPAAQAARTILVLAGAEARLRRVEIAARTQAQARAAAPFLFEGALADDGDTHYAVGDAQDQTGARLVAAISAQRLRVWLERARSHGADPHLVTLDCAIWPTRADEVVIAALPNRVIVAGAGAGGFAIEPSLAAPVFARWLAESPRASSGRIILLGGDGEHWRRALGAQAYRLEPAPAPDAIAALVHGAVNAPATAPNLRQGEFAPTAQRAAPLRFWRFAALLAAAALLLQIGSHILGGVRDAQAADQTMAAAERDFRSLRPELGRIVNLRAQVAALRNQLEQSARHPVLTVSTPVVEALRQHPAVRLESVQHQMPGRTVRLVLTASDTNSIGTLVEALRGGGLSIETHDLPPQSGRYATELAVEAPL